jgi:hypothetical protein
LSARSTTSAFIPEEIVRAYGAAGAYGSHVSGVAGNVDLTHAIMAMAGLRGMPVHRLLRLVPGYARLVHRVLRQ